MTEQIEGLWAAYRQHPYDANQLLVIADWLEEYGVGLGPAFGVWLRAVAVPLNRWSPVGRWWMEGVGQYEVGEGGPTGTNYTTPLFQERPNVLPVTWHAELVRRHGRADFGANPTLGLFALFEAWSELDGPRRDTILVRSGFGHAKAGDVPIDRHAVPLFLQTRPIGPGAFHSYHEDTVRLLDWCVEHCRDWGPALWRAAEMLQAIPDGDPMRTQLVANFLAQSGIAELREARRAPV